MPFQGNGVFQRLFSWVADRNTSIPITASRFDADENDIAQGLSMCVTRDGQGSGMTGPLSITLASGTQPLTIKGSGGTSLAIDKTASGNGAGFLGMTAGVLRWIMVLGTNTAESGGNAGSDFVLTRCSDAGAAIDNPLSIARVNGIVTFAHAIVNGPSDGTLKENIAPLEGSLDKVRALQGVSFNMIGDEDKRRQIGLVAQDVAPVVPEVIQEFHGGGDEPKLALDYPKLTALLIEAVKEQQARIEALEKRLT